MKFINTTILNDVQKVQIIDLWNKEYPVNLKHHNLDSFNNYLQNLSGQNHILLVDGKNIVSGWYVDFFRENEKWFAMILNSNLQGKGFGTELLNKAKQKESELNGWVIDHHNDLKQNGDIYLSPLKFYEKNEFKVLQEIRLNLDTISAVKIKWKQHLDSK